MVYITKTDKTRTKFNITQTKALLFFFCITIPFLTLWTFYSHANKLCAGDNSLFQIFCFTAKTFIYFLRENSEVCFFIAPNKNKTISMKNKSVKAITWLIVCFLERVELQDKIRHNGKILPHSLFFTVFVYLWLI